MKMGSGLTGVQHAAFAVKSARRNVFGLFDPMTPKRAAPSQSRPNSLLTQTFA